MTETIRYETLVESFEDGLLNRLRGHGVDQEFLETWVPDEDPVKSVLNMVEAAEIAGVDRFDVAILDRTLPADRIDELKHAVAPIATVDLEKTDDGYVLHLDRIGG